jgi:serine/threonine protein kinase/Leucine-rich repeat (LRR) protein
MTALLSCPSREKLEQLVAGAAPAEDFQAFTDHLEHCPHCVEQLEQLDAYRRLVTDVQRGVRAAPKYWSEEASGADTPAAEATAAGAGTAVQTPAQAQAAALASLRSSTARTPLPPTLLTPAQEAGELGRFASFRILEVLGTGGMGIVLLAEDVQLKRRLAVKVMRPEVAAQATARQRFLREAQAAAALEHDHIVPIYQVGEERGIPFLAMPLLKGTSLDAWLQRPGALVMRDTLRLARQIALGLAAAHQRGLVHRDIKPANLWLEGQPLTPQPPLPQRGEGEKDKHLFPPLPFVGEGGRGGEGFRIKILDFGLARPIDDNTQLTEQGVIVGTPSHMAPEAARGEPTDQRGDLFSLGVVLYRMCTGQLPFPGANTLAVLSALATETPPRPQTLNPEVPAGLDALVMQMLAKEPAQRPASAQEVADRLLTLETELTAPVAVRSPDTVQLPAEDARAAEPPATPAARRWRPRSRGLVAAGVALAVLLPLTYLYGGLVWRIATNQGELVIESNDPNIEVTIKGPAATVYDKAKDRRFVLTAGAYEVEVREDGDGGLRFAAKKVTITRGGKETFHAELKPAKTLLTEVGKAAERILAAGGRVTVRAGDQEREVKSAKELPPEPFAVVAVNLAHSNILDDGLVHLEPLSNLAELDLTGTSVGDEGLAHLEKLSALKKLTLEGTDVRDTGLKHLLPLRNLVTLNLAETKVSDAGLEQLQKLPKLQSLKLAGTRATGPAAMALRKELTKCVLGLDERQTVQWVLSVGGKVTIAAGGPEQVIGKAADMPAGAFRVVEVASEQLTDDDLPYLQPLTNLKVLNLSKCKVTDAGLMHLQPLTNLQELNLTQTTGVTGEGFVHLKPLTNLKVLRLSYARVTAVGLAHLQGLTSLEELDLDYLGRVVADTLGYLKPLTKLSRLSLTSDGLNDASLARLEPLTNLTALALAGNKVTDAGLEHLKPLTNLAYLILSSNGLTDAGLEHLKPLTKLTYLNLSGNPFGDAALVHLKALPILNHLALDRTQVSDAGLVHLEALTNLDHLGFVGCPLITNEGMVHLQALPKLVHLNVTNTKVTAAGVEPLRKARPGIDIRGVPGK